MASFPAVYSHLSYNNRYYMPKLEFSHDQDGHCPKTTFSIVESAESSETVCRDPLKYSGSEILSSTYIMAATDRMMLRNLTRATDFFANWAIKTQLVHLENFHLVYVYQKYSAAHLWHHFQLVAARLHTKIWNFPTVKMGVAQKPLSPSRRVRRARLLFLGT